MCFALLANASLAVLRTLLKQLLACLNFTLESEDLYFWYKQKKGDFYELWQQQKQLKTMEMIEVWPYSMRDVCINSNLNPPTKLTSSSRSTDLKDILPWKISQMITKTIPISMRIVKSNEMRWDILLWNLWKSMETETTTWSEFPNGRKAIVEQILASEERNKSKRAGLWESQSGIRVGKLTIWVRSFEIEKL